MPMSTWRHPTVNAATSQVMRLLRSMEKGDVAVIPEVVSTIRTDEMPTPPEPFTSSNLNPIKGLMKEQRWYVRTSGTKQRKNGRLPLRQLG